MSTTSTTASVEHVDVLIVGAGISGIGAAYYFQTEHAGQDIRDPGGAGRHAAEPGTCSATRAFAPIRTCTPSATSSSRGGTRRRSPARRRSSPTCARRPPRTASTSKIRFHHKVLGAAWSTRRRAAGSSRSSGPTPASGGRSAAVGCSAPAATTATTRDSPLNSRAGSASAARSCTPSTGPRIWTTRGKRVVVIGSGATAVTLGPGDGRHRRARDDAAALADLRHAAAVGGHHRQHVARSCSAPKRPTRSPAVRTSLQQRAIYRFCQRYPRTARG